ncbi:hypothetical protein ACFWE3_06495 [Mycobacteriaceae bacterium NPDC060252]
MPWSLIGLASAHAAPPPPPPVPVPAQLIVPGSQSAPQGALQYGAPGYANGPAPATRDARGVGVATNSDLGGVEAQMPNAQPGTGPRSAMLTGPSGGVVGGDLTNLDPGAISPLEPAPTPTQTAVPTVGVGGSQPTGLTDGPSGPMQ